MKNHIGYLPQYPNFFSWMTASETLSFMGTLSGISKINYKKTFQFFLEKVGLGKEADAHVGTFSGDEAASWHRTSFITQASFHHYG